jgi:glycosyltransferase involved in cell wall biosynthesis
VSAEGGDDRPPEDVLLLGMGWPPGQHGGLNRYVRSLLEALRESGTDPTAVVVGPAPDASAEVRVAGSAGDALPLRLWRYARAVPRSPAVVDAHFALYAFGPVVLGRLRRAPLVVHFHGPWADESRGLRWPRRAVERAVYLRARELVVLSAAFRRVLIERYRVQPWRIHVVAPGVDLERFSPGDRAVAREALRVPAGARVAVAARRLVPRMGLGVLLDAWEQLADDRRLLLIVGDGPERQALEARAGASVRFLGRVSDEELVACYRAADVAVVPSLEHEGFGLVVLEALACGTPTVVTDSGGLPAAVAGLDTSLVVAAGDAGALAARLAAPLPERERCRAFAERFTWARTARESQAVYARALRPPAKRRLRVVYVDHTAKLSGGELALLRLLPALAEQVDAHVVLAEEGPLVERLQLAGISVEVLPLAAAAREIGRDEAAVASLGALRSAAYSVRLARRLRALRPDLVHTNSLKAALYGGVAGRIARVPVVWHVRDRIAEDYLPASTVGLVRRAATRLPRAVIANSAATLATLPGAPLGRVVPSPVAVTASAPGAPPPLRVGMVGRIAPWKGQHVFLEAFARAFPDGPEQATVVGAPLFGSDEEAYYDALRRLSASLGLNGRVELTGFREDVGAELARLHVLVHASTIPEPFGQTVAEGLAAGLPVVATDAGGPSEMIEHGFDGLLYPPGDVEALADALRRLAADEPLRGRLGTAARERATAFAPERVAELVLATYREALAR